MNKEWRDRSKKVPYEFNCELLYVYHLHCMCAYTCMCATLRMYLFHRITVRDNRNIWCWQNKNKKKTQEENNKTKCMQTATHHAKLNVLSMVYNEILKFIETSIRLCCFCWIKSKMDFGLKNFYFSSFVLISSSHHHFANISLGLGRHCLHVSSIHNNATGWFMWLRLAGR